jgi:hypothetical protein
MWYQLQRTIDVIREHATQMNPQEWFLVFVVVVIVGFFCMRGFGSRTYY